MKGHCIKYLTDYLWRNADRTPDKLALVTDERTFTWGELAEAVSYKAGGLADELQSSKQEVVAILLPNCWEFVVSYLAVLHIGHIALPLDINFKRMELDAVLSQIPQKMLITNTKYAEKITARSDITLFEDIEDKDYNAKPLRLTPESQIASLVFTSGTTGKPKAAPYTHANHVWNIETCSKTWNWDDKDTLLISLPLSHWYGIVMGLSGCLYHGNTMYLQAWFNAEDTLKLLSTGKISMFTHVSQIYSKLLEPESKKYDLSGVRLCISGASPLPPAIWDEFKARYNQEILECYGSSETGRIASNLLNERIAGSPGRPLPDVKVKLSDNSEVLVKSPGIFPGYFNNKAATKAGLTEDGFWKTGDIGHFQDGRLVLKGRTQERIRKRGYHISPRDIEWELHQYKGIKEVHVMGFHTGENDDDKLVYFIVSHLSKNKIMQYCKENIFFAWRPDHIVKLKTLPRTRSGKTRLGELREVFMATGKV